MATVIDVTNIAYEARDQVRHARAAAGLGGAAGLAHTGNVHLGRPRTRSPPSAHSLTGSRPRWTPSTERCEPPFAGCPAMRSPPSPLRPLALSVWPPHRARSQGARAGAEGGGGEDLLVRAAGGREAEKGAPPWRHQSAHRCVCSRSASQSKGHWGVLRDKKEKSPPPTEPPVAMDEVFARIQARPTPPP